jgi:Ca-activated chloride channel family protein
LTLSTIAVGSDADTSWLSELARLGGGRYYFTNQFSDIPKIVIREVNAATKVSKIEGQVEPQLGSPSPILRGLDNGTLPPLAGYVATKPKDAATTVLRSDSGDPIPAQWQYGLGRVVAWTSDAAGMWTSAWTDQPRFSKVWDQSVRWSMAPTVDRSLQVSTLVCVLYSGRRSRWSRTMPRPG